MMKFLRAVLFPFTFLYGFIVIVRNVLYDTGLFKSETFKIPIISVGNLTVGGSGKTPMTEYLVHLLKADYKIAVLSRGYGRKTRGYYEVDQLSSAAEVGDEPLQLKSKFPFLTVAVCEDRLTGIRNLQRLHDLILLDDAYQHRSVKPGFSILLFEYARLQNWQWLLPTGDLREPMWGRKRADCLVITKTPATLSDRNKQFLNNRIRPLRNQPVFFSYISYTELVSTSGGSRPVQSVSSDTSVLLLTGIANPRPLVRQISSYTKNIQHHSYPDHHAFTRKNMIKLAMDFNRINARDKIIITTEKDWQRLKSRETAALLEGLPVYFLPVTAEIHQPEKGAFDSLILNYVKRHTNRN